MQEEAEEQEGEIMGDMADMYDFGDPDDFWSEDDAISELMSLSDHELAELSASSRTPKIVSICHQAKNGKKLSEKQRFCLAFWVAAHVAKGAQ